MALMITKMLVAIALAVLIARPSFAQQNFLSGQTPPGVDRRLPLGAVGNSQWCGAGAFPSPRRGVYWRTPAWSEDGRHIAVVRQDARGNALGHIDVVDGEGQIVLPHTHDEIGWPIFWGSYLLFDSPYSGIDNIHAVHLSSGAHYQVTSRPLAATHVSVDGDSLLFEDYTVEATASRSCL